MATYKELQADIQSRQGRVVKTCWIAHVKELNGLSPRQSANRISPSLRKYPCPAEFRPLIEQSMQRFGMLP